MRILIASAVPRDPDQGAAGTLCATIDTLRELGHEVYEVWAKDLGSCWVRHGNLYYLLELPFRYRNAIRRWKKRLAFDVIQLSQPYAWLAAREHRQRRSPGIFVNRSHGWEEHVYQVMQRWKLESAETPRSRWRQIASLGMRRLLQRSEINVVRYSDGIVVGSEDDRDFLMNRYGLPSERLLAVAPGLPGTYVEVPGVPLTPNRLRKWLYVGQFTACKGPDVVARVINRVFPLYPDLEMTWITQEAYHQKVRQMISPELQGRLRLRGWMAQSQLASVYDEHGLFLFPSYFEGFAKTFLEAMARGLCVVGTAVDGMRQVIRNEENGFLSTPGDVVGLSRQATYLLEHWDVAKRVGSAARATAHLYTWRSSLEALVGFFEALLHGRRCAQRRRYN